MKEEWDRRERLDDVKRALNEGEKRGMMILEAKSEKKERQREEWNGMKGRKKLEWMMEREKRVLSHRSHSSLTIIIIPLLCVPVTLCCSFHPFHWKEAFTSSLIGPNWDCQRFPSSPKTRLLVFYSSSLLSHSNFSSLRLLRMRESDHGLKHAHNQYRKVLQVTQKELWLNSHYFSSRRRMRTRFSWSHLLSPTFFPSLSISVASNSLFHCSSGKDVATQNLVSTHNFFSSIEFYRSIKMLKIRFPCECRRSP